jgi:hypothetical protein
MDIESTPMIHSTSPAINTIPFAFDGYQNSCTPSQAPSGTYCNSSISVTCDPPSERSWSYGGCGVEVTGERSSTSPEAGAPTPTSKRRKRIVLSPEDSREVGLSVSIDPNRKSINKQELQKRMQQNRESQRSFRGRQTKLIQNLRQQIQELTEENEKLTMELTRRLAALGMEEPPSIKESSRGGGSGSEDWGP